MPAKDERCLECGKLAEALRGLHQHMIGLRAYLQTCSVDVIVGNLEETVEGLRREADEAKSALADYEAHTKGKAND